MASKTLGEIEAEVMRAMGMSRGTAAEIFDTLARYGRGGGYTLDVKPHDVGRAAFRLVMNANQVNPFEAFLEGLAYERAGETDASKIAPDILTGIAEVGQYGHYPQDVPAAEFGIAVRTVMLRWPVENVLAEIRTGFEEARANFER